MTTTLWAAPPVAPTARPRRGAVLPALGIGAVAVLGLWWTGTAGSTGATPGGVLTGLGELAGLLGSYLVCAQLLLVGRVPWFERAVGFTRLLAWHRSLGTSVVLLVLSHVALMIVGGALLDGVALWSEVPSALSMVPTDDHLRFTVGALGDHSAAIDRIAPGTRVLVEGPFGHVTADRASSARTLLVAGGAGIGPIRALTEELLTQGRHVVVIHRAHDESGLALADEFTGSPQLRYLPVPGRRSRLGHDPLDPEHLSRLVPDVASRDVFCLRAAGDGHRRRAVGPRPGRPPNVRPCTGSWTRSARGTRAVRREHHGRAGNLGGHPEPWLSGAAYPGGVSTGAQHVLSRPQQGPQHTRP